VGWHIECPSLARDCWSVWSADWT